MPLAEFGNEDEEEEGKEGDGEDGEVAEVERNREGVRDELKGMKPSIADRAIVIAHGAPRN